jgi:hypothetical protein
MPNARIRRRMRSVSACCASMYESGSGPPHFRRFPCATNPPLLAAAAGTRDYCMNSAAPAAGQCPLRRGPVPPPLRASATPAAGQCHPRRGPVPPRRGPVPASATAAARPGRRSGGADGSDAQPPHAKGTRGYSRSGRAGTRLEAMPAGRRGSTAPHTPCRPPAHNQERPLRAAAGRPASPAHAPTR